MERLLVELRLFVGGDEVGWTRAVVSLGIHGAGLVTLLNEISHLRFLGALETISRDEETTTVRSFSELADTSKVIRRDFLHSSFLLAGFLSALRSRRPWPPRLRVQYRRVFFP